MKSATELSTASAGEAEPSYCTGSLKLASDGSWRCELCGFTMDTHNHKERRPARSQSPQPTSEVIAAMRNAAPSFITEESALRLWSIAHGIAPAGGIGGDETPLDDPVN